jgi:hypothetical protein
VGTTFIIGDLATAFQIAGGPGHDTIQTTAFTFTADQRNAIFATASIEKIIDPSGTYTAPPPNANVFSSFNGDLFSDALWRNNSDGAWGWSDIHNNTWHDLGGSSTAYSVVGVGDLNADGFSDVLWRNDASGAWGWSDVKNSLAWHDLGGSSTAYNVVGVGDLNNDGFCSATTRPVPGAGRTFITIMPGMISEAPRPRTMLPGSAISMAMGIPTCCGGTTRLPGAIPTFMVTPGMTLEVLRPRTA